MAYLKNIRIFNFNNKFLSHPIFNNSPNKKGILKDTFTINKPGLYILDLLTIQTTIYLEKGDLLIIDYSSTLSNPNISFDDDNKDANQFMFESMKISNKVFYELIESILTFLL
ncbi:MAG: hypothetical protein WCJ62_10255 [Flavobacterium sp.]